MTSPLGASPRFRVGRVGFRLALGLILLGLVVILLGWNGVAGNIVLAAQLPYLISGGMLGLALVITGAAMMVTQAAREDRQRLEGLLQQLVDRTGESGSGPRVPADAEGLFAAGTNSFHRPDCRLVAGREQLSLVTEQEAQEQGLAPCRVCQPVPAPGPFSVR